MTDGSQKPQKQQETHDVGKIASLIKEKNSIVIAIPGKATLDSTAAALALYSVLNEMGKSVSVITAELPEEPYGLPLEDAIKTRFQAEGDTLMVSIPFKGGVENVTYNIEDETVNIQIEPVKGADRFKKENVQYSYTGGKPDVIITVYAPTLQSLGSLYEENMQQFQGVETINIDRHFTNSSYGTLNYIDKRSPSMCQMVNDIFRDMRADVSKDTATLLYAGIATATNNFSTHSVNSNTFRAAAFLLDKGAVKRKVTSQTLQSSGGMGFGGRMRPMPGQSEQTAQGTGMPQSYESISDIFRQRQGSSVSREQNSNGAGEQGSNEASKQDGAGEQGSNVTSKQDDPLRPKIFQSGSLNKG